MFNNGVHLNVVQQDGVTSHMQVSNITTASQNMNSFCLCMREKYRCYAAIRFHYNIAH